MKKISLENICDCYEYGKRISCGELKIGDAAKAVAKNGMDQGSAQIYLRCVRSMLSGKRYTGTVNEFATSYFLTSIMTDFEYDGLQTALEAVRLHLQYQKSYQGLKGIRKIYDEFTETLTREGLNL